MAQLGAGCGSDNRRQELGGTRTLVPHISLMLCMLSWGPPTSTVRQPSPEDRMGPIVDPQAMSDFTQNSCVGMPRLLASSLQR